MKIWISDNGNTFHKELLLGEWKKKMPVSLRKSGMKISLRIDPSLGKPESYEITEEPGGYTITGSDGLGLSYGIGKFLRTANWSDCKMVPNPPKGIQSPDCSFRTMYFAIHFYNWYQMASTEELSEYCKEMLLYGYNTIVLIVPVINMTSFTDSVAVKAIEKDRELMRLCRKMGLKIGLIVCVNQGLKTTPKELYADDSFSYDPVTGATIRPRNGINICLSKKEGYEYMRWLFNEEMKLFTETGIDCVVSFPYDEGGCGCEKCRPWGARGYVEGCRLLNEVAKSYYPDCKFIAPTWMFDVGRNEHEYDGFYERLRTDAQFIDSIMVDSHGDYPTYPLEHELLRPVVGFPEISMWKLYPWGGYGANPMPERLQEIWNVQKPISDGGMPYSEGCYEDINKFLFAGFYWDKDRTYEDILSEYSNYVYGFDVRTDCVKLMTGIGRNHTDVGNDLEPNHTLAREMYDLAEEINKKLSRKAKKSWRWRILYIRALLDWKRYNYYYLHNMRGENDRFILMRYSSDWLLIDKEAQKLFLELIHIYHALEKDNGENRWTRPVYGFGTILHNKKDTGAEASQ